MTLKSFLILSLILGLTLASCSNDKLDVDASEVKVNIDFVNMDSVFVQSDSAQFMKYHLKWNQEMKDIYEFQLGHCLGINTNSDTAVLHAVQELINDPYVARLEKRIAQKFKDKSDIKEKIRDGFRHLKYHFPKGKLPKNVVFMNTLFASSAASIETELGIGMERYLGAKTDVIQELPSREFFEWIKVAMDNQYLERDAMGSWILTHYVDEPEGDALIEYIIYWGKILYLIEACYPEDDERIILRYTKDDYQWALDNEASFWNYLMDQKLLFKADERTRLNLLKEGPFTPGLPEDTENSPDRLGQFLGWRMVHQYMEDSDTSVKGLVDVDYKEIYQGYETEE